jgi:hypothetical protein
MRFTVREFFLGYGLVLAMRSPEANAFQRIYFSHQARVPLYFHREQVVALENPWAFVGWGVTGTCYVDCQGGRRLPDGGKTEGWDCQRREGYLDIALGQTADFQVQGLQRDHRWMEVSSEGFAFATPAELAAAKSCPLE